MSIIGWVVFGLVVGVIAKFIMPGKENLGMLPTMILGMAGSLLGGFLASLVSSRTVGEGMQQGAGWIGSILGALLLLFIAGMVTRSRSRPPVA